MRAVLLAVAGLAAVAALPVPCRAAGLFDGIAAIFGADPPPAYGPREAPPRTYYRYDELEPYDDVRPRREPRETRRAPPREDVRPENTAIDPVKVPDWYLTDPTLGRGDIVVLARGVFVYEGGRGSRSPADFVPLERSRLSAAERARVAAMTGYRPSAPSVARARTGQEVAEGPAVTP